MWYPFYSLTQGIGKGLPFNRPVSLYTVVSVYGRILPRCSIKTTLWVEDSKKRNSVKENEYFNLLN